MMADARPRNPHGNPVMPKAGKDAPPDWEDQWRREREEHKQTKLAMNEMAKEVRLLKAYQVKVTTGDTTTTPHVPRNKEEADMIGVLMEKNAKLTKQNTALTEKNAQLTDSLNAAKAQVAALKRAAEAQAALMKDLVAKENAQPAPPAPGLWVGPPKGAPPATPAATGSAAKEKGRGGKSPASEATPSPAPPPMPETPAGGGATGTFKGATRGTGDAETQLTDANKKLQALQTANDLLASKASAAAAAIKHAEALADGQTAKVMTALYHPAHISCTTSPPPLLTCLLLLLHPPAFPSHDGKVRELRKALEELRMENEMVTRKANRADELDDLVKVRLYRAFVTLLLFVP